MTGPSPFVIGVAPSGRRWRGALQRHIRDHEDGVIVRVVRDLDAARQDGLDVLVVDDDTSYLSLALVGELARVGVTVVGVFDPDEAEGQGRHHLERVGVGVRIDEHLAADLLLDELRVHRRDPAGHLAFEALRQGAGLDPDPPGRRGTIVAVGGAAGAGRTEVALGLAAGLSCPDQRWLLVDTDDVAPSVARRLGLPVHPNLITALEILRGIEPRIEGVPVAQGVRRAVAPAGGRRFDVLTGMTSRRDWSLLDPDDLELLLEDLRRRWPGVVLDCGPLIEDLAHWVDRFACTRTCLTAADLVVGVLDGSPAGLVRFLDWLADTNGLDVGPVHVVVNRAPGGLAQRADLERELRSSAGGRVVEIVQLPVDARVARAAWDGTCIDRGRFRRGVGELADVVRATLPAPPSSVTVEGRR